jgi:xanthine dehydrogenase large subunit
VSIYTAGRNHEDSIYRSKAVGEPPLMLGMSVFHAIKDAIAATGDGPLHLNAPATPEAVLLAVAQRRTVATVPTAKAAE